MKLILRYFKRIVFFIFTSLGFINLSKAQINQVLEAELALLQGTAEIVTCNNASGGKMVKGLDNGSLNSLTFQKVNIPKTGEYFISVAYYSVNQRNLTLRINDESDQIKTFPATGDWCYQGGIPGKLICQINLVEGENNLLFYNAPIIDNIEIQTDTIARKASTFHISSVTGNDLYDGLTAETAFKTFEKVNSIQLLPGDSLLFKSGETFVGKLSILNESGNSEQPIVVSNYDEGNLPVFDGDGFLTTIDIVNSEYLHFSNIEIKNDGGQAKPGEPENLRYGMYIQNTFSDGTLFNHYHLNNLIFKNIYPTIEVTEDDNTGVNAHAIITSGSWGDEANPTRFEDILIENCFFTRTARHAVVLKAINNLQIRNNIFEHVGGAGMVIAAGCSNILVEKNSTNFTGSSIDSRMAGRGSGIWCYRSKNLTVQYNKFMHAKGIHDSYGMHIDIGNRNVVYQYNYSEDNEGGFVEILGENVNVGYRYNLSVGDGWRKRGNRHGQIFWLAGWSGDPKNPVGSDSIFVFNNSVYVPDSIAPGIWIEAVSKNARIYNNIINVANEFGPVVIKNNASFNDFNNNIWDGNISITDEEGELYRGPNSSIENPLFMDYIVSDSSGFILQSESPAIETGKLIFNAEIAHPFDYFYNNGGFDFYGNILSKTDPPNIGAYNGEGKNVSVFSGLKKKQLITFFPNPVLSGQKLVIENLLNLIEQKIQIQIVDTFGKLIFEQSYQPKKQIEIDTKEFSPGSYFVCVKSAVFYDVKQILVF